VAQFPCTASKESRIIACPVDLAMLGLILYRYRLAGRESKSMAMAQGSCDLSVWTFFSRCRRCVHGIVFKES
jgi:hypothetical protein